MTIKEWKDKAFEGGYSQIGFPEADANLHVMLLSAEAWKAVGKVEGWRTAASDEDAALPWVHPRVAGGYGDGWRWRMLCFVDALASGQSVEEYLATIV